MNHCYSARVLAVDATRCGGPATVKLQINALEHETIFTLPIGNSAITSWSLQIGNLVDVRIDIPQFKTIVFEE